MVCHPQMNQPINVKNYEKDCWRIRIKCLIRNKPVLLCLFLSFSSKIRKIHFFDFFFFNGFLVKLILLLYIYQRRELRRENAEMQKYTYYLFSLLYTNLARKATSMFYYFMISNIFDGYSQKANLSMYNLKYELFIT